MPIRRTRPRSMSLALVLALGAIGLIVAPVAATDVATFDEFLAAWENADESLITLTSDITIECDAGGAANVTRSASANVVVDGAGHTLHNPCTGNALAETAAGQVTIRNLRLTGNAGSGFGILAQGALIVEAGSVVSGHGSGGVAGGPVTVSGSTVTSNGGSGVSGTLNIVDVVDSTIDSNAGLGIHAIFVTITNSTIVDNGDSGILAEAAIYATHATVTGNSINLEIDFNPERPPISLFGSVVADAGQANCLIPGGRAFRVADLGYNHVDDASCAAVAQATEPHGLGALQDNGGPTRTRLPGDGSPLIDAVASGDCGAAADQRGVARPQGFGCEIGSVEVFVGGAFTPTPTPSASPAASQLPDTGVGGPATGPWPSVFSMAVLFVASGMTLAIRRVRRGG